MCVAIVMEPGTELSVEEVFKMGRANADGIGVAWADGERVEWYKSINYTPESAAKFINERKGYFRLVHFRLSTVGGVRVDLCHPFEVGPMASGAQHGHSAKVLIHNGHWYRWTDIYDILKKEEALPDFGPWSDSRLMAYLASHDEDWLDVATGRIATMDAQGNIKILGSWEDLRAGIKVSNKVWDHNYNYSRSGRDRDWPGWGWTTSQWEAYEAHQKAEKAKHEQAEKAAKGSANGEAGEPGASGKVEEGQGQKAGDIRVGGGATGDVGKAASAKGQSAQGYSGYSGRRDGLPAGGAVWERNGKTTIFNQGSLSVNGESKVSVEEGKYKYDYTPWQNPTSKRWYHIPRESVRGDRYQIQELNEADARRLLEQITASVHE